MLNIVNSQCVTFIRSYRGDDDVKIIPLENRRLAIYRRCAMQSYKNLISVETKYNRARSERMRTRWIVACDFWRAVGEYFQNQIQQRCGERF